MKTGGPFSGREEIAEEALEWSNNLHESLRFVMFGPLKSMLLNKLI